MKPRALINTDNFIMEYREEFKEEDGGCDWHVLCFDVRNKDDDFKLWIYIQVYGHSITFLWW